MDGIAHQLHLKENQIHKLMEGKPVQIGLEQMGAEKGKHVIYLGKSNAKKLMKSYLKGKGVRMSLSPSELEQSIKEGSGLIPSATKKMNQVPVEYKPIVELIGGNLEELNKIKSVDKIRMPRFAKGSKEALEWGAKMKAAKAAKKGKGIGADVGKAIGKTLGAAGGTAAGAMSGNPLVASVGGVTGATLGAEAGKYAGNKLEKLVKGRGAKMSAPYKNALKMNFDGLELPLQVKKSKSKGTVDKRVKPSSDEMTLSPYQKTTSPAMNPFVPTTYFQEGGTSSGYGEAANLSGLGKIGSGMGMGLYGAGSHMGMGVRKRGRPRKMMAMGQGLM